MRASTVCLFLFMLALCCGTARAGDTAPQPPQPALSETEAASKAADIEPAAGADDFGDRFMSRNDPALGITLDDDTAYATEPEGGFSTGAEKTSPLSQ